MSLEPARKFVDREKEITLIRDVVEQHVAEQSTKECVINFYGVPGIGKSALLAEAFEMFSKDDNLLIIAVNLKLFGTDLGLHQAKIKFLEDMARGSRSGSIQKLNVDSDDAAIDEGADKLVKALSSQQKQIVLLIDSWEHAPEAMLAWVERMLLLPLVRANRLVCLMGSQRELRWRQFEVRRRVRPYELPPLDPQASAEQVECAEELQGEIFSITAGLPFANEIVFLYIKGQQTSSGWITEHREQLAKIVGNEIQQRVVEGVTFEIRQIFEIMALFREFDVHTLQTILPQFLDKFKGRSQSALLLAVKQMVATRLVSWNDALRAYQLDPTIRKIFARKLEWGEPTLYQQVQQAALEYYQNLIREVPSNRHVYIREYFYHLRLYKTSTKDYNSSKLADEFDEFEKQLRQYYVSPDGSYVDILSLSQLRDLIVQDEELQQLLAAYDSSTQRLADIIERIKASAPSTS